MSRIPVNYMDYQKIPLHYRDMAQAVLGNPVFPAIADIAQDNIKELMSQLDPDLEDFTEYYKELQIHSQVWESIRALSNEAQKHVTIIEG